jgi:hypothetical protein
LGAQNTIPVKIDGCQFHLKVAANYQERAWGLMFVSELDNSRGMIFVFEQPKRHCFWMKDTRLSLDIIWLDKEKKVVDIKRNLKPCSKVDCPVFCPREKSLYVIEVKGNNKAVKNLEIGDKVEFNTDSSRVLD